MIAYKQGGIRLRIPPYPSTYLNFSNIRLGIGRQTFAQPALQARAIDIGMIDRTHDL